MSERFTRFFASRWGIILAGAAIGVLAPLLQKAGNPTNMVSAWPASCVKVAHPTRWAWQDWELAYAGSWIGAWRPSVPTVPRHLSSDCGVCVRIRQADREGTLQALETAGVEIEGAHDI